MADWFCAKNKYDAIAQWAATTAYVVGDLRRRLTDSNVINQRIFRCTTAGTSGGTEPSWNVTKGSTTNDNTCVWTEVTGNSTYGWGAAHSRIRNALAWALAGDRIWVGHQHAPVDTAAHSYTSAGDDNNPVNVICVNDGSDPPTTLATTATERTTVTGTHTFSGYAYYYGITFGSGDGGDNGAIQIGASSASGWWMKFEKCVFEIGGTSSSAHLSIGAISTNQLHALCEWDDVSVKFAGAAHGIYPHVPFTWKNSIALISGSTVPNRVFQVNSNAPFGNVLVQGVDLSACSVALVAAESASFSEYNFVGCKLHASVNPAINDPVGQGSTVTRLVNCDSGDTNYRYFLKRYQGEIRHETVIVKTGGASDGTTPISRKMVSSANSKLLSPLVSDSMVFWQEDVGSSITVEIDIITDNVTLQDHEAWIEVQYSGTSGTPLHSKVSDRINDPIFGTPTNQSSSSVTWTTTGLSIPVKQKLAVTFTPQEKGLIEVKVMLAKPSTTMYFCPKPVVI